MVDMLRSERSGNSSVWVRVPPSVPNGGVAQLVELPALNRKAAGSSPVTPTTYGKIAQSAEQSAVNRQVVGSIPAIPAKTEA